MILYAIHVRELQSIRVRRCTQFSDDMEKAIEAGNLENVKWISHQNNEWKEKRNNYLGLAARNGHLEVLKWLFFALGLGSSCENCGWLYEYAAMSGSLEICTWLFENGAPLDSRSFNGVVYTGSVEVMEWCLHNGGVFNDRTFYLAAMGYSVKIEVLAWLKLNDCPWGFLSLREARRGCANSSVMTWLRNNGCPE